MCFHACMSFYLIYFLSFVCLSKTLLEITVVPTPCFQYNPYKSSVAHPVHHFHLAANLFGNPRKESEAALSQMPHQGILSSLLSRLHKFHHSLSISHFVKYSQSSHNFLTFPAALAWLVLPQSDTILLPAATTRAPRSPWPTQA